MEKKIKSIAITQFDYVIKNVNDEELEIQGHPHHFSEFDMDGKPLKEVRYNIHGDFEEMHEYSYGPQGNLTREAYYPEENTLAEEKTYERDDSGRVVRAIKQYQDGSVDTITYEYDSSAHLVKKITTTDEGEIDQVETFEWDNGILVNQEVTDGEGQRISFPHEGAAQANPTRVTYNDKDQVVTEEELDENGEVFMTVNRTYDDENRAQEVEVFLDGRGQAISRHYFLKYEYTFY